MRSLVLAASALSALASVACAQECENALDRRTMNDCAALAFKKSDAELNALYKEAESRLKTDAEAKKLLIATERAWLVFRNAECAFSASGTAGGSIYPMVYSHCLDTLTKARITDLKRYLQCEEGILSCPVPPASK